jgi:Fic family protein
MPEEMRHSRAEEVEIIHDPEQLARQEAQNGLRQFQAVVEMVEVFLQPERPFRFRPSQLQHLHRIALNSISAYAGNWRPADIEIGGSRHKPPGAFEIPEQIEALCDYVNEKWQEKSALHLAAYVLWKLNWIHPFTDGNGRTSRAASYMVLCLKMGYLLPGRLTIPDQIASDKTPYYRALELADNAWENGKIDLSSMKELLGSMLARQLVAVHEDSKSGDE